MLDGGLAVCRLGPEEPVPPWATARAFWSVTRTARELSIVCEEALAPASVRAERGFRAIVIEGPLDFSWIGILASLAGPLAEGGVSMLALSTYDTDYLLVREESLGRARDVLAAAGHEVA